MVAPSAVGRALSLGSNPAQSRPRCSYLQTHWGEPKKSTCDWHGITCDSRGRVSQVQLKANNLRGSIPPEIGLLTELTELNDHPCHCERLVSSVRGRTPQCNPPSHRGDVAR